MPATTDDVLSLLIFARVVEGKSFTAGVLAPYGFVRIAIQALSAPARVLPGNVRAFVDLLGQTSASPLGPRTPRASSVRRSARARGERRGWPSPARWRGRPA
jgi:hypothetical protein